jgi:hypothetical protein
MLVLRRMATLLGAAAVVLSVVMAAPSAPAETTNSDVGTADWYRFNYDLGPGRDSCPKYYLCVWTGTNFTGYGLGLSGDLVPGDSANWMGLVLENNVHSAVNKTTVRVHFYDIHGSVWTDLGYLDPGYDFASGWAGANSADGIKYIG